MSHATILERIRGAIQALLDYGSGEASESPGYNYVQAVALALKTIMPNLQPFAATEKDLYAIAASESFVALELSEFGMMMDTTSLQDLSKSRNLQLLDAVVLTLGLIPNLGNPKDILVDFAAFYGCSVCVICTLDWGPGSSVILCGMTKAGNFGELKEGETYKKKKEALGDLRRKFSSDWHEKFENFEPNLKIIRNLETCFGLGRCTFSSHEDCAELVPRTIVSWLQNPPKTIKFRAYDKNGDIKSPCDRDELVSFLIENLLQKRLGEKAEVKIEHSFEERHKVFQGDIVKEWEKIRRSGGFIGSA